MSMTSERAVAVLTDLRKSIEAEIAGPIARSGPDAGQSVAAITLAIERLTSQRGSRRPPRDSITSTPPMSAAAVLTAMKRFSAERRRRRRAPRRLPMCFPATKANEALVRQLWGVPLGQALALLPVSTNGREGRARRHFFVVRKVERFLDSLPTL